MSEIKGDTYLSVKEARSYLEEQSESVIGQEQLGKAEKCLDSHYRYVGKCTDVEETRQEREDRAVSKVVAAGNRRLKRAYKKELARGGNPLEALRRVRRKR